MPALFTEERMYGCDLEHFRKIVEASPLCDIAGPGAVVISLLSDVQEMLMLNKLEDARQTINRVKFIINEYRLGLKQLDPVL